MSSMITVGNETVDLNEYFCSDKGLLLPLVSEYTWPIGGRAFIYLLGLLWIFMAVAIIADVFMCSIERITSKTTTIRIADSEAEGGYQEMEVKVWNNTVANLSLLALGTSAPEILLSIIETVGNGFKAGDLGPGTIVGSAAFNLLVISGICVMSIPSPDTRRVAEIKVFFVTGFTCIFAYVWMAIVLMVSSPNVVDIWEGVVTLVFFPVLILVSYLADRNFCMGKKEEQPQGMVGFALGKAEPSSGLLKSETSDRGRKYQTMSDEGDQQPETTGDKEEDLRRLARKLGREVRDGDIPEDEAAKMAIARMNEDQSHDRGWYRINATRMLTGGRKLIPRVMTTFQDLSAEERAEKDSSVRSKDHTAGGTKAVVEFTAAAVSVLENEGKVRIGIRRYGKKDIPCSVMVETINGTALAGEDYKAFKEVVKFAKEEELRQIYIEIVDDFEWEPDEFFFVKLSIPEQEDGSHEHIALGNVCINQVTIINDDEPGKLEFAKPSLVVKESFYSARITVNRVNGCDGHVSVKWKTTDITAKEGKDFKGKEGVLLFDNQEITKTIDIPLFESNKKERDECFAIELGECDGGAELGKIKKTIVTIVNDDEFNGIVSRLLNMTKANVGAMALTSHRWVDQFKDAMNVNGGDLETATFLDYVLHFLTFGWKLIFAFVPPAKYLGGWPCFLLSLAVIGLLTTIINDLAGTFGCLIGLEDAITAITFVALGTSMPDTFASKTAALMEKTADSSVGNINGSNSVNVFLGLGLPWTIASIYWAAKGGQFDYPAKSLGFSVVIYSVCAFLALSLLLVRRYVPALGRAELGGPKIPKIICGIFLISLWVIYIMLSALQVKGIIKVNF
ncbi:sodium/calcium exchanger 3-like isoform X2 [Mercenaria mercenaria]|uniref:sodium/calcium exchanger 3-like isoform X2 n=1 Tax=Mercenaria mercenaria TaxID=6596 RepID=UPI001E1D2DAB|nr:sodium/calcium exchanger 3-like isoform X2 [Mercenaria mercenaria]